MSHINKISFIGFGHLARALVQGALEAKVFTKEQLIVTSPSLIQGRKSCQFHIALTNQEAAAQADIIVLAVKPQQISMVCREISKVIRENQLVISVAAGQSISQIEAYLNHKTSSIVRAMPNTAAEVSAGVTALFYHPNVTREARAFVHQLFQSTGLVVDVTKEDEIDLITALSGSGPAYFFYLQEALMLAGIKRGLSKEVAQSLVKQTMYGASLLTRDLDVTFEEKRAQVTSPSGTTAAAISHLEDNNFLQLIDSMIEKAYLRAQALK